MAAASLLSSFHRATLRTFLSDAGAGIGFYLERARAASCCNPTSVEKQMAQGKSKKLIRKKARKGFSGYPVATVAFYGPTNVVATKLVCGIIKYEGAEAEPMKKWSPW